ncbi:hypothetical protein K6W81_14705 [Enterobacter sp. MW07]|nr:hypothetical protein [Enterobacter sp. MW07]
MTLTKEEQIQAIYDLKVGYTLGHADIAILKSMARQLLASMEQEPIAWLNDAYLGRGVVDGEAGSEDAGPGYIPVYREPTYTAPPAPVSVKIPPEKPHNDGLLADGWNACRTAMLQGAEHVSQRYTLPDGFDFDRFNDVVWLEAVASNPHMHSPTTSTIAMVALELNRKLAAGNSPVIPDGWILVPADPTAEMLQSGISAHYERSQIKIHDRPAPGPMTCAYVAMLAAAPQQEVKNG